MQRLGKFQLLVRVGLGSFGAVWKARDTELDRVVALKLPHAVLLESREGKERFFREARAAAQLRHPGLVTVHEVATLNDLPAIVADFIEGVTLHQLLEVRKLTFTFDNLIMLDDPSLQRVLREVDAKDLAMALRGVADELREKIFKNLSSRAAEMLREDIAASGPVRSSRSSSRL